MANQCQCSNPECPVHSGINKCANEATTCLYHMDMQEESGTMMCEGCASHAFDEGLFSASRDKVRWRGIRQPDKFEKQLEPRMLGPLVI